MLAGGFVLLFLLKYLVLPFPATELRRQGYHYGQLAEHLVETGQFGTCNRMGTCHLAWRMPFQVYALAGLRLVVGSWSADVALAKGLILESLLLASLLLGFRRTGLSLGGALVLLSCLGGPQFLLHSQSVKYEEGFVIQMLASAMALGLGRPSCRRLAAAAALVGLVLVTKPSLIFVGLGAAAALAWASRGRAPALRALVVVLCLGPLAAWGAYNHSLFGSVRLGSSYDGANLWRGLNDDAYAIYPPMNLDHLVDGTTSIVHAWTGERIAIAPVRPPRDLGHEWDRSDWYAAQAVAWARANPEKAAELTLRKLFVFLFEIRNTPKIIGEPAIKGPVEVVAMGWMAWMRLLTWATAAWLAWILLTRRRRSPEAVAAAVAALAFVALYAGPCIAGFVYERHVVACFLPFLVAAVFCFESGRASGAGSHPAGPNAIAPMNRSTVSPSSASGSSTAS